MANIHEILDTDKARYHFIRGLVNLSKAQEMSENLTGVEEEELYFLRNAMTALEIKEVDRIELENLINATENEVKIEFDNMKQSIFFLREGIQICYVDKRYTQAEKEMIGGMAKKLKISDEKLQKIEAWVEEGMEWSNRGETLLEMEG
jgi:hypothetical protein